MAERQSRNEKRYMTEAQALGSALQDALAELVQIHGDAIMHGDAATLP